MPDLKTISGLPLTLTDDGRLQLGPGMVVAEAGERRLDELTQVVLEPEQCRGRPEPAYWMYNGVSYGEDAVTLRNVPLRYELTLMPPSRIGRELLKTHGHLHTTEPRSGSTYAEICEVLVGTAHFVFQTLDPAGPDASMVYVLEARAGDKVVIPPNLDHLTINAGPGPLLFSDVIALDCRGVYERYKAAHGAAYLEVADHGTTSYFPNPSYRTVAPLQRLEPREYPQLDLSRDVPLYTAFVRGQAEKWAFLTDPRVFGRAFPDLERLQVDHPDR